MSKIKTLFEDSAKQTAIYPRTKFNAVSDTNGNTLGDVATLTSTTVASGVSVPTIGFDMDLLWTNSSPTSAFAPQTLSLDLSEYSLIIINTIFGTGTTDVQTSVNNIVMKNIAIKQTIIGRRYGASGSITSRGVDVNSNGITFTQANENGSGNNNTSCIPYQIYGIKGVINNG